MCNDPNFFNVLFNGLLSIVFGCLILAGIIGLFETITKTLKTAGAIVHRSFADSKYRKEHKKDLFKIVLLIALVGLLFAGLIFSN